MTPEEMVSRLLYRDGLMLVIDKPAGLAVHRGPKGGEILEDHFDALRFGLPRRRRWPTGSTATPPAAWCSAATARRWRNSASCSSTARIGKTYWAMVEGARRPTRASSTCRLAASTRKSRLVDEARSAGQPS
jgi:tRNA pseudouridine32 synthase/23S rRNA pseudouridine746 synthase